MEDMKNCLQAAITSIEITSKYFNQNKVPEGYKQLEDTIAKIDHIIYAVSTYRQQGLEIEINEVELMGSLQEAMTALENKDTLLLSDILEYEVKELLERSLQALL